MARLMAKRPTAIKKKGKNVGPASYKGKGPCLDNAHPRRDKRKKTQAQKPTHPSRHKG